MVYIIPYYTEEYFTYQNTPLFVFGWYVGRWHGKRIGGKWAVGYPQLNSTALWIKEKRFCLIHIGLFKW